MGKFEILGKYAKATFSEGGALADYDQETTEFNFNYVIKEFNARRDVLHQEHEVQRSQDRLHAGRRRPADPDVTTASSTKE